MSASNQSSQVDIDYALFTNDTGELLPIDAEGDRHIEDAVRAADPYKRIALSGDPVTQSKILHTHVVASLFGFSFQTHSVNLTLGEDSRWDPVTKTWIDMLLGASRAYPVVSASSPKVRLWLCVSTQGADAQTVVEVA